MVLALRQLRLLISCATYDSRAAPLFGRRLLCAAALEPAKEEEFFNEEEGVLSKRALMQEEGFTEPQIEAVLATHPRSDKLSLLLTILKDRGITGPTAATFVSSHIRLLHGKFKQFLRLQFLEDAGISSTLIKEAILKNLDQLSAFSSSGSMQEHFSFFKDLGLSSDESLKVMVRCPSILRVCIETRLRPRCEVLRRKGVSKDALCKLVIGHTFVFLTTEAYFLQKLKFMEELGLDLRYAIGMRAFRCWARYSIKKLHAKFDFLKTLGLSHEEVVLMVQRLPCVLCMHEDTVKKKFEFFRDTLKFGLEYMLHFPILFTYSFERRLIPRWTILQDLKEKGLLKKPVSMVSVFAETNLEFAERFNVDPRLLL